ncbi:MAG: DUF4878 domain-containing protein [Acidobacteria bacterium]|nr:DUF4878 domain-containing protein [Acidobacteriota bacterium]MCA1627030.1 DUF4878 domain-containing protein [Acidobacteriota bacterium]
MLHRTQTTVCVLLLLLLLSGGSTALAQNPSRSPTETTRLFYQMLREKKFREAFLMSIYRSAIEALSAQEFEELRPDFEKMAIAISEKIPAKIDVSGEQISGDAATVFVKVLDADGKEKIEPASLIKVDNNWIVGDRENLELVKKAGKQFFFEARINAHHNDVQDMMTRISLGQVLYSQNHNGKFGNLAELVAAGVVPKDIEGTESTGYRFQINRSADGKSWYATAEPAQYGRSGRLSFYLDATGVRSGDVAGKPLVVKN